MVFCAKVPTPEEMVVEKLLVLRTIVGVEVAGMLQAICSEVDEMLVILTPVMSLAWTLSGNTQRKSTGRLASRSFGLARNPKFRFWKRRHSHAARRKNKLNGEVINSTKMYICKFNSLFLCLQGRLGAPLPRAPSLPCTVSLGHCIPSLPGS